MALYRGHFSSLKVLSLVYPAVYISVILHFHHIQITISPADLRSLFTVQDKPGSDYTVTVFITMVTMSDQVLIVT